MKLGVSFVKEEGGFTTPAAALAILLACSLMFVCARGVIIGSRSGQIQYVADAGALAADNVVAEFVTIGQAVDAVLLSMSLLGLTVYAVSAVAAFIPGAQSIALDIADVGSKILKARDHFAQSATRGLNTAQKALPALCAVRAAEVVQANANASGLPYAGIAITSPMTGIDISLADDTGVEDAARKIESKEDEIQEESKRQAAAQEKEDAAKERAWIADCGSSGMCMFERAGSLSNISGNSNPRFSTVDTWRFSVPLERAKAYYAARYDEEPGENASGSPEEIGESVARKHFYAYAHDCVSEGYIEVSSSGDELPHLQELIHKTSQVSETSLYTDSSYPVSETAGTRYIHAYSGCPMCEKGTRSGTASVSDIDAGTVQECPLCKFSVRTLGRVPSASTAIDNGFEHYYRAVVEASREYAEAVREGDQAKQRLGEARDSIGQALQEAVKSLKGNRYDPQPPGRYGCLCLVFAPNSELHKVPFLEDGASIPARVALSGATLAGDPASDEGNVITGIASGIVAQDTLASGPVKVIFGAWGAMLDAYTKGNNAIKSGFRKTLGAIPVIGTTLSEDAASKFEEAIGSAGLEPADLKTYKPVVVNTSHIIEKDGGKAAQVLSRMKQAASMYSAISIGDADALVQDLKGIPEVSEYLDEHGLTIASIPLADLGLGSGDGKLYFPLPNDIAARLEDALSKFSGYAKAGLR